MIRSWPKTHSLQVWRSIHFIRWTTSCSRCSSFTWNNSLAILVTESKAWAWTVQRNLKFLNRLNSSEAVRWYVQGKNTQPTSLKEYHFIRWTTSCNRCSSFTWNNSLAILVTERHTAYKFEGVYIWRSIHFIRWTTSCNRCSSFTWNNSLAILVTESKAWAWTVQRNLKFLNRLNSSEAVRWYVHGQNTQPTSLKEYTFHTLNDILQSL